MINANLLKTNEKKNGVRCFVRENSMVRKQSFFLSSIKVSDFCVFQILWKNRSKFKLPILSNCWDLKAFYAYTKRVFFLFLYMCSSFLIFQTCYSSLIPLLHLRCYKNILLCKLLCNVHVSESFLLQTCFFQAELVL